MSEKVEFVIQAMIEGANVRQLCRRYGVSPTTGYKWLNRFLREGKSGLFERSRRPLNSPRRTAGEVEDLVIGLRKKNPAWGGRKIKERLERLGHSGIPSASTITDNGSPWNHPSSNALTKIEVWLLRLGIDLKRSGIRHPQTLGKDERLHRSLKAEVLQGRSFRDLVECQDAFDRWRYIYNHERPHEALEMRVPADRYRISPRDFPERLPEIEYSANDSVRKVQMRGYFHFDGKQYWVGTNLHGLPVAVRPTLRDGVFDVYFCRRKVLLINRNSGSPMGEPEC